MMLLQSVFQPEESKKNCDFLIVVCLYYGNPITANCFMAKLRICILGLNFHKCPKIYKEENF